MTSEITTGWQRENPSKLKNILALNFCFNVESNRLFTSDVLSELSKRLRESGNSCTFYGVGNFGFRMTDHFSPLTSDGKHEGHFNDPANDHDIITITNADFTTFQKGANEAIQRVKTKYSVPGTPNYFHWANLTDPKWNISNFVIPSYCTVGYKRLGDEEQTQMELHWLENKSGWHKELLSKYAPWYSTHIGFPIVNISGQDDLSCGIWQPYAKETSAQNPHEVRIAVPEIFGNDTRDVLQAVRVVFGVIQASIGAQDFATLSAETKDILRKGITSASKNLNEKQRENAVSRLKTTLHRAQSLEKELEHDCFVNEYKNPFEGHGTTTQIITGLLDEIDWGKNVLGKTVKDFLK